MLDLLGGQMAEYGSVVTSWNGQGGRPVSSASTICCAAGCPPIAFISSKGIPARARRRSVCSFCSKGSSTANRACTSRCRKQPMSCARMPRRTAGICRAFTSRNCSPPKTFSPKSSTPSFIPPRSSSAILSRNVFEAVERFKPARAVLDSVSDMRLLARDSLRYRRQILGLKQFFVGRGCTLLLLNETGISDTDPHIQSLVAWRHPSRADGARLRHRPPAAGDRRS